MEDQEELGGPPEGLGGPAEGLGGVRRPSRSGVRLSWRDERGREALPEVREGLGGPPGGQ